MNKIVLISLSNAMGMQLYCTQTANVLATQYDVSIIVTKYFDEKYLDSKVKVHKFFDTNRPTLDIHLFNLVSYIRALKIMNNADVLHFLNSHPANIILMYLTKNQNRIFTLHDPIPHSNDFLGKCRRFVDILSTKLSDKIIIHSKMHMKNKNLSNILKKVYVAPLASKTKNNNYMPIINKNNFLFFGRIEDYKGIDLFINASERLLEKRNDFLCTIAGNGDFSKYQLLIKNMKNYTIKNYVIPEDDVKTIFENSTICVMPYKTASQSGVIPLSYYYSRPVIVTDIDSLSENVEEGKTGFVIKANVEDLMKQMELILDGVYDISKMSLNALEYGNTKLSMEVMVDYFIKIYNIK